MFIIEEECKDKETKKRLAVKMLIGNGAAGYRGTFEEDRAEELPALNVAGLYDGVKGKWRETVNAPNPFYALFKIDGKELDANKLRPLSNVFRLDIKNAVLYRKAVFELDSNTVTINYERFLSRYDRAVMGARISIEASAPCEIEFIEGIDACVWDINGPHLENISCFEKSGAVYVRARTQEQKKEVVVAAFTEAETDHSKKTVISDGIYNVYTFRLEKGKKAVFSKSAVLLHSLEGCAIKAEELLNGLRNEGYDRVKEKHMAAFSKLWDMADVEIMGDPDAQLFLRYSIYHLLILAPPEDSVISIAARGISGQTYKGAVFWDTEIFLLPFFINTDPKTARNLIQYRINTLDGARRKASYYGYRGAFYAWESQESGDDACSDFNVTDVYTGRGIRTYFKDKQIHISGDVVYGIMNYIEKTGDESILLQGAGEVIFECARFYLSCLYKRLDADYYEILDVVGPDEYHERVNNNAYTNRLAAYTLSAAQRAYRTMMRLDRNACESIVDRINFRPDLKQIEEVLGRIKQQAPDENGVIEQFDGYFRLEDVSVKTVKSRVKHPNEYLGTNNGVAFPTQVIKQADVVTMLCLFENDFTQKVLESNYDYYIGRTEHGSSLSASMYGLLACKTGRMEDAYKFFIETASIDYYGKGKQYAGGIYIGGSHPAASGGAYMLAVYGFAGLKIGENGPILNPRLPPQIKGIKFRFLYKGNIYIADITNKGLTLP